MGTAIDDLDYTPNRTAMEESNRGPSSSQTGPRLRPLAERDSLVGTLTPRYVSDTTAPCPRIGYPMVSQASSAVSAYLTGEPLSDDAELAPRKSSVRKEWSQRLVEAARAAEQDGESELSAQLFDLAESRGKR